MNSGQSFPVACGPLLENSKEVLIVVDNVVLNLFIDLFLERVDLLTACNQTLGGAKNHD